MTLALGARHSFGLYLQPITADLGMARQTLALSRSPSRACSPTSSVQRVSCSAARLCT
jgi:hypothetical protein